MSNNSIKYVDENGMFWEGVIIKIVDIIGGAILQYFVDGILIMEVYAPGYDD